MFKVNPTTHVVTVLYSFQNGAGGENPYAVLLNVSGTLYGTTYGGGANGYGAVFKITLP